MMVKEPELKLFGRNILLPEKGRAASGDYSGESSVESSNGGAVDCGGFVDASGGKKGGDEEKAGGDEKQGKVEEVRQHEQEKEESDEEEEEVCEAVIDQDLNKNPTESHTTTNSPSEPFPENGPPQALKKPDKILPCPRCKSMDTKFCYFNNYNVNQPRHFCKGCQRYWTDGGTMRNVPVGSGRRKNKSYCPRNLGARPDPNGGVLCFGHDNGPSGPVSPWPLPAFYPPYYYYTPPVWNAGFPGPGQNVAVGSGPAKRLREGEPKGSPVVVPKTLRVDDPREAAKSSIWSTLGIACDSSRRGGLIKALQSRGDEKIRSNIINSSLLQANPAALSRSVCFRERV